MTFGTAKRSVTVGLYGFSKVQRWAVPTPPDSVVGGDMALATHFITLDIHLSDAQGDLVSTIEAALAEQGDPLRWAITQVNAATQTATVEAVVTTFSTP